MEKETKKLSKQEKMISKVYKEDNFLEEENEINFDCNACGRCCHNQEILISTLDIFRMRRHFKVPTVAFLKDYFEIYPGANSKMPVCLLKFIDIPNQEGLSMCPFLKPVFYEELENVGRENKTKDEIEKEYSEIIQRNIDKGNTSDICTAHLNKPEICRLYPLGRGFSKKVDTGEVATKFFMLEQKDLACDGSCFDCSHKRTVKNFLTSNNIGLFVKIQEQYNKNIISLSEISVKGLLTNDEFSMLVSLFYNFDSILFFQKISPIMAKMPTKEDLERIKEIYSNIPTLDNDLMTKSMKETATDDDIYKAYEHLVGVQAIVIENLTQKYAKI